MVIYTIRGPPALSYEVAFPISLFLLISNQPFCFSIQLILFVVVLLLDRFGIHV